MQHSDDALQYVLDVLLSSETDPAALGEAWNRIEACELQDHTTWSRWLSQSALQAPTASAEAPTAPLLDQLVQRLHDAMLGPQGHAELPESLDLTAFTHWCDALATRPAIRVLLLAMLARDGSEPAMIALRTLLSREGLLDERQSDRVFAALMQRRSPHLGVLFPTLFDVAATPAFAAAALDLANFATRENLLTPHPARARLPRLVDLFGKLTIELERIEERGGTETPDSIPARISASISLGVALCDCFALNDYREATQALHHALTLGHRRLRCEAAWALARFGDEKGLTELLMLADEPVARLRVLAYAEELGVLEKVEPEYRTPAAIAEAELATWLAHPQRMGLAPMHLQVIDSRELAWPGFDGPVSCHLLKFRYEWGNAYYENIGIVGPQPQAVTADLLDQPLTRIYELFAGLQAEHSEILEGPVQGLAEGWAADLARLERRLKDHGLDAIVPLRFGSFFGERILAAKAHHRGVPGIALADSTGVRFWPDSKKPRALGVEEWMAIDRGRRLLGAFNEDFGDEEENRI